MSTQNITAIIFRVVAILEAITWLALLIGMFFKWVLGHEEAVAIPGMTHGIVFVAYILVTIATAFVFGWNRTIVETPVPKVSYRLRLPVTIWALAASIPPFGTLFFEVWAKTKRTSRSFHAQGRRVLTTSSAAATHLHPRVRVAVSGIFALNGLLAAMWVAHIPVVQSRTGVDHATLGGLLLALGGSAFVGMQVMGPLTDRFGSRYPTVISAIALSGAIVLPGLATGASSLALALVAFGFCNGALDVCMNSQAVLTEREYGRPIMSSFHGFFSVGGLIGSGVVAATVATDVPLPATLLVCCVLGITTALLLAGSLLAGRPGDGRSDAEIVADGPERKPWGRIALLAAVAFSVMLAEGTAYDWSALHLVERFDQPEAMGAVAFGAFSATMVIARFSADAVSARLGPVAVVRVGSLVAVAGIAVVICSPTPLLSVVGWAIFGLGVAGGVPQLFTAAGNLSTRSSGQTISLVVGFGYVGMLSGPAVIGPVSHWWSLGSALWLAAAGMLFAALAAPIVRPRPAPTGSADSALP